MAAVLNAFKLKEFDLEPVYADWPDAPVFNGHPKKDLPVDDWLEKIREGCVARNVPEEYWYKVAQHYMGPKAKARLDELKQVIVKVHGGKYRWTWKKFKVAMQNMGWSIDKDAKETIKVTGRPSGLWFTRKRDTEAESSTAATANASSSGKQSQNASPQSSPKPLSRSGTFFTLNKKPLVDEPEDFFMVSSAPATPPKKTPARPSRARSNTVSTTASASTTATPARSESGFWPSLMKSTPKETEDKDDTPTRPNHPKTRSDTSVVRSRKSRSPARSDTSGQSQQGQVTTVAQAPVWLLNACNALEYITNEHPKAMSILSAILVTVGSIPAIPAIAAGAGGAVLASSTAHAVGAIAVGLGQALGSTVKNAQKATDDGHGAGGSSTH